MKEEIKRICSLFRVLKDWTVCYDEECDYKGQCNVGEVNKLATIYAWGDLSPCAPDYLFHEVLHIAFRAAKAQGRDGEELFIQDICKVVYGKTC